MVKKSTKFPSQGELVIGKVSKVNPFSAFVKLDEYPGVEGMVHISEVARKWIKDIRDFVKEGQQVVAQVMNVEEEKGHVTLSLKRVSKNEADAKLKEVKREQKAEKMLEQAAKEAGVSVDKAYAEVGFKLQEEFGEMFKAFQQALTPTGRELLAKRGIPEKWIAALQKIAETSIELKENELKAFIELKCNAPNGVELIRSTLQEIEKQGIEVHYISAPKYSMSLKTKDAKRGEKTLQSAADAAIKKIEAAGGEGSFLRG